MAVCPPEPHRRALHRLLPDGARLTRVDKWHITLAFLGTTLTEQAAAAALAELRPPARFRLRLAGGGRFGAIVWAGVEGDLPQLHRLRDAVRTALAMPPDERPYLPHLTVSYRGSEPVDAALAGHRGEFWTVDTFTLMRSTAGEYLQLDTFPLPT